MVLQHHVKAISGLYSAGIMNVPLERAQKLILEKNYEKGKRRETDQILSNQATDMEGSDSEINLGARETYHI